MVSQELTDRAQRWQQLRAELEAARLELADAIRAEAEAGARQVDIVKATGYTREQVRRIVNLSDDGDHGQSPSHSAR